MAMDPVSNLNTAPGLGSMRAPSWGSLLCARRFFPLLLVQSFAALDAGLIAGGMGWRTTVDVDWVVLGTVLLPLLLFWPIGGQIADKVAGDRSMRVLKALEILVMGAFAAGIVLQSRDILLGAVFFLSLLFAVLTPLKHAILARNLRDNEFITGRALLAGASIAAAWVGIRAGYEIAAEHVPGSWLVFACLLPAIAGFAASAWIPATPAAEPGRAWRFHPKTIIARQLALCRDERSLGVALIALAWSWLAVALIFFSCSGITASLGGVEMSVPTLMAALSGGIVVGCLLGDRLCDGYADIGLLPLAAVGQALLALDLALLTHAGSVVAWRASFDLFGLGVCAGSVYPMLQARMLACGDAPHRGRSASFGLFVCAASAGLASAIGVILSAPGALFLGVAAGGLVIATFTYRHDAHLALRFLTWLLIHTFYRVEKKGFEHIPSAGPAVLVCNHVSFVDSVIIMAAVRRPIRFVMDHRIHQTPIVGFLFRHSRTIPIATAKEDPAMKESAFAAVASALRNGELIGLFPEGRITHTGEINHFRYGVGRIVEETPVPVVPMALRGLWGSFFSRRHGPAMSKPQLLRWLAKVELVVGEAVPAERGTPEYLQEVVTELRGGMV